MHKHARAKGALALFLHLRFIHVQVSQESGGNNRKGGWTDSRARGRHVPCEVRILNWSFENGLGSVGYIYLLIVNEVKSSVRNGIYLECLNLTDRRKFKLAKT